ncbi:MAG: hypothetical protein Q7O12_00325 [Deltaproteobacteria bacterium]|nr:hypothetical protein [Deltaproteobacteria bacterium]
MINISQIEKITESEAPSGSLSSRTATDPGSYPQQYGKKYLLPGRGGEFTFTVSCGNKTDERGIGRPRWQIGPATIILNPEE